MTDQRIPVNVLTGFLGSGKTTLLRRLLASPALADCAVLINELGQAGLDHHLLEHLDKDTVLLKSGCVCCTVRADLQAALTGLFERRQRGAIPPFSRVVIETTGLADPTPVIATIMHDAVLKHHFRLGNVITTVDAVHGMRQLQRQAESRKQAAVADRIVVTKGDLASTEQVEKLRDALLHINACATLVVSHDDVDDADLLLRQDDPDEEEKAPVDRARWLRAIPDGVAQGWRAAPASSHASDITSLSLVLDAPLDWIAFGVWLSMLLHSHGNDILRVKGILHIRGAALPVAVHGVQHLIHAPTHLRAWPDEDRRSRLVLIGRLPPARQVRESMAAFGL